MRTFILDTETTGIPNYFCCPAAMQPEIIQVFGVMYDFARDTEGASFGSYVKPQFFPRDPWVIKETKSRISDADLEHAPPFRAIAGQLRSFIETADTVLAHNVVFDKKMIDIEMERLETDPIEWPRSICCLEQTVHLRGRRLTMTALHLHLFQEKFREAHHADWDVRALLRIAKELWHRGIIS